MSLHGLNVQNVVEGPDHFVTPPLEDIFYVGPCWATLPLRQQTLHNGVPGACPRNSWQGGGGASLVQGGGRGGTQGGLGKGLVRRGGCTLMTGWGRAKPRCQAWDAVV